MKRNEIGIVILKTVAVAGLLSVAVLAPNALQILRQFSPKYKGAKYNYYVKTRIQKLESDGYIEFKQKGAYKVVRLTEKGRQKLELHRLREEPKKRPKWDKKWRVLLFDIKEKRRYTRNKLRDELIQHGFVRLQNSIWVTPYDCEEFVTLLKADLKIGKDVIYMISDHFDGEQDLKKYFHLKS